jgi:hypothetical protein
MGLEGFTLVRPMKAISEKFRRGVIATSFVDLHVVRGRARSLNHGDLHTVSTIER